MSGVNAGNETQSVSPTFSTVRLIPGHTDFIMASPVIVS